MYSKLRLPEMDRPFTEDERQFLTYRLDYILEWLRSVTHWLATFQTLTLTQGRDSKRISSYEFNPRYNRLSFYWFIYYGRVYIGLKVDDPLYFERFTPGEWRRYKVFDQNRPRLDEYFLAHYTASLDNLIHSFFPKIKQENGFRICTMPVHIYLFSDKTLQVDDEPYLTICERISDRWFCNKCLQSYGLDEWSYPPLSERRKSRFKQEWDKLLRPQRRLEMLERDDFTCQQCHRNPRQHPEVKLAVTHIMPVTEGGKTAPDNLQTLCTDCRETTTDGS